MIFSKPYGWVDEFIPYRREAMAVWTPAPPSLHAEQGVLINPPEQDPGVPPGQAAPLPQR